MKLRAYGSGVVTGTEKQQDIIEKDKGQYSEEDRIGDTKHKRV